MKCFFKFLLPLFIVSLVLSSCDLDPHPAYSQMSSEATKDLQSKYNTLVEGIWTLDTLYNKKDSLRYYQQIHFYLNGTFLAVVRVGNKDSVTVSSGSVDTHGNYYEEKVERFRYFVDDTLTGSWQLYVRDNDKQNRMYVGKLRVISSETDVHRAAMHIEGTYDLQFYNCSKDYLNMQSLWLRDCIMERRNDPASF